MKTKSCANQSGSTLVVVIMLTAILMVTVGIAVEYTVNINRHVQRGTTLESAVAVGDACIEVLFNNWRTACRGTPTQALPTNAPLLSAIATPAPSQFPNLPAVANFVKRGVNFDPANDEYNSTYTISNYKVVAVTAEWAKLAGASATPEPALGQLAQNQTVNSVTPTTSATFNYIASADVTLPALGPNGNVVAKVRRVFQKQQLSPWNFAIFYVDPLEIHPGPLFTVTGWVHTNSDLYTAHSTLTFADKVTYGSDWNIAFMPGDLQHLSDVPASPNYPNGLPPARDQALQPFGMDSTLIFNTTDTNPNNDSFHELIQPPVAGYTDPMAGPPPARYYDQAGIIITVKADNSYIIGQGNGDGTYITLNPPASGPDNRTSTQKNLFNMFSGAITDNQTIQDNREGASGGVASIRLATLDISLLENNSNTNWSSWKQGFNGIVYIYDNSATTHPLNPDGTVNTSVNLNANGTTNSNAVKRGIRLLNGKTIPSGGLTVASNNPVYIQGDFNTGGTGATVPSNNLSNLNADGTYVNPANPPAPQVSGYTRAPTSILADAVTILSNSWSDGKSGTVPNASPTTVNTAIIAGTVPTARVGGDGSYSGGAENFPRFLENWTNDTLTYYGSMVELYKSQQSTGEWGKANVYVPPTREWLFDTNFKFNPPPGSIMVYSYIKGKWSLL
jgi:hypothetical protein